MLETRKKQEFGVGQSVSQTYHKHRAEKEFIQTEEESESHYLSDKELEYLLHQLSRLLGANLTLEKSFSIIADDDPDLHRTSVAKDILSELRQGQNFSEIFSRYISPQNAILSSLIKSGELSGNLSHSVDEMAKLIVARNKMTQKIQSSMVYPAILSVISILSLIMILFYVIPQFSNLLDQGQTSLPISAQIVFNLSDFAKSWWWLIFTVFAVLIYQTYTAIREGGFFTLITKLFTVLPGFTELPDKIHTSIICRLLGTLLTNNVKLLDSLKVVQEAAPSEDFDDAVGEIISAVESGSSVGEAFSATELFPNSFLQMIRIGEESGELGAMFSRAADMFEEDIDAKIKRFLILFEPMILLTIGILIGGLLYGLFSAILSVNSLAF